MRRLVASSLIVASATWSAGCGLIEEATSPRPGKSVGALEAFAARDFEIELPCVPAQSSDTAPVEGRIDPVRFRMWSCEDSDTAYLVSTAKLPVGAQGNLDDVARGAAEGVDGDLVMNKKVTYAGLPARDVRIESTYEGKPATAFGRVLVRKRVLYQVLVVEIGEHTKRPPALFRKILASLSFS
jgi:hypothetical protein